MTETEPHRYAKYLERKFIISMLFTSAGIAGLFLGELSGEQFYWLAAVILAGHKLNKTEGLTPWGK